MSERQPKRQSEKRRPNFEVTPGPTEQKVFDFLGDNGPGTAKFDAFSHCVDLHFVREQTNYFSVLINKTARGGEDSKKVLVHAQANFDEMGKATWLLMDEIHNRKSNPEYQSAYDKAVEIVEDVRRDWENYYKREGFKSDELASNVKFEAYNELLNIKDRRARAFKTEPQTK